MNDIKRLKEQQKDKHPGFSSYLECMTRTLFSGLATFALGFSGTYFAQKLVQKRLPYDFRTSVLIACVVSTIGAYKVTSDRTLACQSAWMAAEDKHTALKESKS